MPAGGDRITPLTRLRSAPRRLTMPMYFAKHAFLLACLVFGGASTGPAPQSDEWLERPVDDATYRTYLEFFEYSRDVPLDAERFAAQATDGLVEQALSFVSTPGVRVTARLYRLESDASEPRPAAILLHGGTPLGKDGPGMIGYGRLLARAGITTLTLDLLHYGERKTGLLDTFSLDEKAERLYGDEATYLSFVTQTVKDAGRAIDLLISEEDIDPGRVILVGISRGAVVAAIVGGAEPRFAGAALLYAGHSGSWAAYGHHASACPANYVGRIAPRPLLMVNGNADRLFDKESTVLPLQALAGQPADFVWLDTGHAGGGDEAVSALMTWVSRHFAEP